MTLQNQQRTVPAGWKTPIMEVPELYRQSVIDHAWSIYDGVCNQNFEGRQPREKNISAETTSLSPILYAAYIPYHLIKDDEKSIAISMMREDGPSALMKWVTGNANTQESLLIIGDLPVQRHVFSYLDRDMDENPSKYLIAGPGTQIEMMLREYCLGRDVPKSHLGTIDNSNGQIWGAAPGPALEELIIRLFKEQRPTRVIAFEPVRLPSTQIAMEVARGLNLPIESIAAPTIKKVLTET
jgi:hypothetical protein